MLSSHVQNKYYAISIAPLTTLYYFNPTLSAAALAAIGTATGVRELLRRRKPSV